jgi:hypothetical protein
MGRNEAGAVRSARPKGKKCLLLIKKDKKDIENEMLTIIFGENIISS